MADNESTHSQGLSTRQDFPEVKDKIISSVKVVTDTEGLGITVRFHDETTLYFDIESHTVVTPVFSQWEKGEETPVKRWQPIQSNP